MPAIPSAAIKVLATGYIESGGGMAANASVAIARLGGAAAYWGRVGADAVGERILAELAAEGVDISAVRRVTGCISSSDAILVSDAGERLVCVYNDPALERDSSWLPLHAVSQCQAVMADIRWSEGARGILHAAGRHESRAFWTGMSAHARIWSSSLRLPPTSSTRSRGAPSRGYLISRRRTVRCREFHRGDGRRYPRRGRLPLARRRPRAADATTHGHRRGHARGRRRLAWRVHASAGGTLERRDRGGFSERGGRHQVLRPGGRRGAPSREEVENALARSGRD